jgi:hypothetical protein
VHPAVENGQNPLLSLSIVHKKTLLPAAPIAVSSCCWFRGTHSRCCTLTTVAIAAAAVLLLLCCCCLKHTLYSNTSHEMLLPCTQATSMGVNVAPVCKIKQ